VTRGHLACDCLTNSHTLQYLSEQLLEYGNARWVTCILVPRQPGASGKRNARGEIMKNAQNETGIPVQFVAGTGGSPSTL
jgi:hypothetical protein